MTSRTRTETRPSILDRLIASMGSPVKVAAALEVNRNYCTRWAKEGFIPEIWALYIEEFGIVDKWGPITCHDVLREARAARSARIEAYIREAVDGLLR